MAYVLLIGAILAEVAGTLCLRAAATGNRLFYAGVLVGYVSAFSLLALSLRHGMPLGIAYGIWTAAGVALTAVASRLLFGEAMTARMVGGIALIAVGVLCVEIGGAH
ncbi:multidrug efflux SMR transporter [Mycobacterium sp. pV006]|uniref:multidrug efflux SMR transporter n=1 Tax=Mycobacterium sp. pV006 TaxID=3238983 RepID=UPI00351BA644